MKLAEISNDVPGAELERSGATGMKPIWTARDDLQAAGRDPE